MDREDSLERGADELARQLRQLRPVGHGIDRDALMFRAGQRSARGRLHAWQSMAGLMMIVLVAVLAWLNRGPSRTSAAPAAVASDNAPPAQAPLASLGHHPIRADAWTDRHLPWANEYLRLRTRVTDEGLDAIPTAHGVRVPTETINSIADWLRLRRRTAQASEPKSLLAELKKGNLS